MNTSVDIQDWLEAQSKDYTVTLSQSDLKFIEGSICASILEVLSRKDQDHDEKMEIIDIYRAVRDKIEAHIVR
jgi:hypothetical protein